MSPGRPGTDNVCMKALTVRRPWANLIMLGAKDIENRSWETRLRGPLVIHAGQRWDPGGVALARTVCPRRNDEPFKRALDSHTASQGYLGVVLLIDICDASIDNRQCSCGLWASAGQYHWQLAMPRRFDLVIPGPGGLGLRAAPPEVEAAATDLRDR
jgi:hypothetical protein